VYFDPKKDRCDRTSTPTKIQARAFIIGQNYDAAAAEQELADEDMEEVAGGILPPITRGIHEGGITKATWETGGISKPFVESGD
jgi:hypothetical protein